MVRAVTALLNQPRKVTIAALIVLTLLAWAWLFAGAGMGMDPLYSLSPLSSRVEAPEGAVMMPAMAWSAGRFALTISMWWIMMIAMMLPAASPMVLLYARADVRPATNSFVAGYLVIWGAFSLVATLLQLLLERAGWLGTMDMALQIRWLSAGVIFAAGVYQLSPFKNACLNHCRNPARFLASYYRAGVFGAWRMGVVHGAYCVGCCWLLMALLFVGGVMNLAWIALLTALVAAEKLLPFGRGVALGNGVALIVWSGAILFF